VPENAGLVESAIRAGKNSFNRERKATSLFHEAAEQCRDKVKRIAKECRVANRKYNDVHFNLAADLPYVVDGPDADHCDTLWGLVKPRIPPRQSYCPKSVKRVPEIFDSPTFINSDGITHDLVQGADGDCWFIA
jgi:hypothetical protein